MSRACLGLSVVQLSESAFKTRGQLRLVSQKSRGENGHKADVKEIKRLYREGYSLARIGTRSGSALHSPHHGNRLKTGDGSNRRENLY
jgi:hypothetical protein